GCCLAVTAELLPGFTTIRIGAISDRCLRLRQRNGRNIQGGVLPGGDTQTYGGWRLRHHQNKCRSGVGSYFPVCARRRAVQQSIPGKAGYFYLGRELWLPERKIHGKRARI